MLFRSYPCVAGGMSNITPLRNNWGASAMLSHALDRIEDGQSCLLLFYEDDELKHLSSNIDNQHAVWMCELAKLVVLHQCIDHDWE